MIGQTRAAAIPAPGFEDPTRDAQSVFRAVLDALAHPTRSYPLVYRPAAPEPLGGSLGAVGLTLLDEETSVWLGGPLGTDSTVGAWLAFHTGVRTVSDSGVATFIVATPSDLPDLDTLILGTEEEPHRSATALVDVRGCSGPLRFRASGPGIDGRADLAAPWADDDFLSAWQRNSRLFPRGVDLVLVDDHSVCALPRTTHLTAFDTESET